MSGRFTCKDMSTELILNGEILTALGPADRAKIRKEIEDLQAEVINIKSERASQLFEARNITLKIIAERDELKSQAETLAYFNIRNGVLSFSKIAEIMKTGQKDARATYRRVFAKHMEQG